MTDDTSDNSRQLDLGEVRVLHALFCLLNGSLTTLLWHTLQSAKCLLREHFCLPGLIGIREMKWSSDWCSSWSTRLHAFVGKKRWMSNRPIGNWTIPRNHSYQWGKNIQDCLNQNRLNHWIRENVLWSHEARVEILKDMFGSKSRQPKIIIPAVKHGEGSIIMQLE